MLCSGGSGSREGGSSGDRDGSQTQVSGLVTNLLGGCSQGTVDGRHGGRREERGEDRCEGLKKEEGEWEWSGNGLLGSLGSSPVINYLSGPVRDSLSTDEGYALPLNAALCFLLSLLPRLL